MIATLRWFQKRRNEHRIFRALMFAFFVIFLGWNSIVRNVWGLQHAVAIDDILIILPFAFLEIVSTLLLHQVDLAIDHRIEERSGFIAEIPSHQEKLWVQLRTEHGPWILICLIVVTIHDAMDRLGLEEANQAILALVSLTAMAGMSLIVLPLVVRVVLPLRTMPTGPLRSELEQWARHEHVRFSDILIWKTRYRLANAAVTGILPGYDTSSSQRRF